MPAAEYLEHYRNGLLRAFPPRPFEGLVSTHGECDDGVYLRAELAGRSWVDLTPEVVLHGSNGLCLLEPEALAAFLPAWLLYGMQRLEERDPVGLEFTLYFLCPSPPEEEDGEAPGARWESEEWDGGRTAKLVALFDAEQRRLVAELLSQVLTCGVRESEHVFAEWGLKCWAGPEGNDGRAGEAR